MRRFLWSVLASGTGIVWVVPATAQNVLDRADPSIAQKALPATPQAEPPSPSSKVVVETAGSGDAVPATALPRATAIVVDGGHEFPAAAFANTLIDYVGRGLSPRDLSQLAGRVADVARRRGYPLATAMIPAQSLADGILRVRLDPGRIDAVRVVGAINPFADRILTKALVTRRAVRGTDLERAIALVGDIPGVTVRRSRFVRQDGFGILLVTIVQDRASGYAQIDNRGSVEIGPIRSTVLATLRGIAQPGDELGILASNTPIQATEFAFLRARYAAPVDYRGSTVTVSASYGRAHPGAALAALDVIGHSTDFAVAYALPVERSRTRSWWTAAELRALKSDQSLLGAPLRNDRIATLTTSAIGAFAVAGGALRGEARMIVGLPLAGVSHQGDPRISRSDGDARFFSWSYEAEWTVPLGERFGVVLASAGQLASRPLLASQEIGLGGQLFGRAYDNAERTGDDGVVGSAEIHANLGPIPASIVDRVQPFLFIDGGYVANLRQGSGGGALLSAGGGLKLGMGRTAALIEVALPLNADRFDSGSRQPRLSLRLSRAF